MDYPVDHIAIAVPSIERALPIFELVTGGTGSPPETIDQDGVRVVFVGQGAGRLELLEPISAESPVARFLARRGQGMHHIAYRVPDLTDALRRLAAQGVELIDTVPREGAHGRRVAFLHPRSIEGVLVELVEG